MRYPAYINHGRSEWCGEFLSSVVVEVVSVKVDDPIAGTFEVGKLPNVEPVVITAEPVKQQETFKKRKR